MANRAYTTWIKDLSAAPTGGHEVIDGDVGRIIFIEALDGTNVLQPGAKIEVGLGDAEDDFFPLKMGDQVANPQRGKMRIRWAAQAGITARLLVVGDVDGLQFEGIPTATLVVGDLGANLNHAAVAVDTTADLIIAANANRRRLTVTNIGGATVYLGGSGVAVGDGWPLLVGDSFVTDQFNGALYGVTASGSTSVRYLEESA